MKRLIRMVIGLVIVAGCILGAIGAHEAYVWNQIEKQALAADQVEGEQE